MEYALLKSVIWDISPTNFQALSDSFVIRRVLTYGTLGLLFKTINHYGKDKVKKEFTTMLKTSFEARRYHYLKQFVFIE